MQQGRRRQIGPGIMLLFYQIFAVIGVDNIPPVTLALIGGQVAIFLRLFKLPWHKISQVCISSHNVWRKKEYVRLLYGALEHADDWHLYYNMASFALKGQSLERRFGSVKFLYIVSVFTLLSSSTLVAMNHAFSGFDKNFGQQCAVGFSAVIFALKVLTTHYDAGYTNSIMGIPMVLPARYAVWAELVLIQLITPNASFLGHLAGILVGVAYVSGPLKFVMDTVYSLVTSILNPRLQAPRFQPRAEASGFRDDNFNAYVPTGMSEEEQLQQAMADSMRNENAPPPYPGPSQGGAGPPPPGFVFPSSSAAETSQPPPPGFVPDIDELRNRRQARFGVS